MNKEVVIVIIDSIIYQLDVTDVAKVVKRSVLASVKDVLFITFQSDELVPLLEDRVKDAKILDLECFDIQVRRSVGLVKAKKWNVPDMLHTYLEIEERTWNVDDYPELLQKLRDCYLSAVKQGKQGQIPIFAGGGIGMNGNLAADTFKMICLGANGVFIGKLILQIAGCVGNDFGKCNACNTGKCPIGITTQNPKLTKRLDIDTVSQNIVNYICAADIELKKLLAPVGNSTLPIGRSDALICVDKNVANRLEIPYAC